MQGIVVWGRDTFGPRPKRQNQKKEKSLPQPSSSQRSLGESTNELRMAVVVLALGSAMR